MNCCGSIVADMITTRKSGRFNAISLIIPSKTSVVMCRSCTSSIITMEYCWNKGSDWICLINTPSVTNFNLFPRPLLSNRIWYPIYASNRCEPITSPVSSQYISFETRSLRLIVDKRRGCVQTMWSQPADIRYCGTWVLLPHPVSPIMTVTMLFLTEDKMVSFSRNIGRFCLSRFIYSKTIWQMDLKDGICLLRPFIIKKHV